MIKVFALGILCFFSACKPSDLSEQYFDIPQGPASGALISFSEQAHVEILFDLESLHGVQTNSIRGDMTIVEALDRLIKNTSLSFYHDQSTNSFAISCINPSPHRTNIKN